MCLLRLVLVHERIEVVGQEAGGGVVVVIVVVVVTKHLGVVGRRKNALNELSVEIYNATIRRTVGNCVHAEHSIFATTFPEILLAQISPCEDERVVNHDKLRSMMSTMKRFSYR